MGIIDGLKTVGSVLQEAGKIEQYQQILDAQQKLLEMQGRIAELESENRMLKDAFATKKKLTPENNVYWLHEDGTKDGPFCTGCWDAEHKLVRLHTKGSLWVKCPKCQTSAYTG